MFVAYTAVAYFTVITPYWEVPYCYCLMCIVEVFLYIPSEIELETIGFLMWYYQCTIAGHRIPLIYFQIATFIVFKMMKMQCLFIS